MSSLSLLSWGSSPTSAGNNCLHSASVTQTLHLHHPNSETHSFSHLSHLPTPWSSSTKSLSHHDLAQQSQCQPSSSKLSRATRAWITFGKIKLYSLKVHIYSFDNCLRSFSASTAFFAPLHIRNLTIHTCQVLRLHGSPKWLKYYLEKGSRHSASLTAIILDKHEWSHLIITFIIFKKQKTNELGYICMPSK